MFLISDLKKRGLKRGRKEGRCEAILILLNKRFGDLPNDLVQRIQRLSARRLSQLVLALLDFQTLEDLRHWLPK